MSLLDALYRTYLSCEEAGLVGRVEDLNSESGMLLPIYHTDKTAKGTANEKIIRVTLNSSGTFVSADILPNDENIVFPVTEESVYRSGSAKRPHSLVDELSYVTEVFDEERHSLYLAELESWCKYNDDTTHNQNLNIIYKYIKDGNLLKDIGNSLFNTPEFEIETEKEKKRINGKNVEIEKPINIVYKVDDTEEKLSPKVFVTYEIIKEGSVNFRVSTDEQLHEDYIEYVDAQLENKEKSRCSVSGEFIYCADKHRGVEANTKVVSGSTSKEVFYGRFEDDTQVYNIGFKAMQKINLMLRYLLKNPATKTYMGDGQNLLTWSSSNVVDLNFNISDRQSFQLSESEKLSESGFDLSNVLVLNHDRYTLDKRGANDLKEAIAKAFNPYKTDFANEHFYVLVINKVNNARYAIKYFRDIYLSDLVDELTNWYISTSWEYTYTKGNNRLQVIQSPSFYDITRVAYGKYDGSNISIKNDKLVNKIMESLIPCIIEGKRIPQNIFNQMMINITNRRSYKESWNRLLSVACSIIKKYKWDYYGEEVTSQVDNERSTRSYLYGRLAAVNEAIENTAMSNQSGRITNVEKSWTQLMRYPEKGLLYVEEKVKPYLNRLKSNPETYGLYRSYEKYKEDIISKIDELSLSEKEKNKAVDEEFVIGYYAQRKEIYSSKKKDEEK